jgi:hypothetical protein
MRYLWAGFLLWGGLLFAGTAGMDANVNTRYNVETVIVSGNGWTADVSTGENEKISSSLRRQISSLIGDKLNPTALDEIAKRLRRELHAVTVTRHVLRGAKPACVKVVFEVRERDTHFDVSIPKFLYNARQGWSGAVEASAMVKRNAFSLGLVSDGDELPERFAGVVARYENANLGWDRARFNVQFGSFHEQWNRATLEALESTPAALETSSAYRSRQNLEPTVTLTLARSLNATVGASFDRMEVQTPGAPHIEASNAAVAALRYHRQLEGAELQQDVDAGYGLRAGTSAMAGDYDYWRHHWSFRYALTHGKHVVTDDVSGGVLFGRAPLFERFVLGNTSTLRGWNKAELDPTGGNRMAHNSVDYRYGPLEVFYDAGAVWDSGQPATVRHAVGAGLRQGSFFLALAFPVRGARMDPVLMMGMNY